MHVTISCGNATKASCIYFWRSYLQKQGVSFVTVACDWKHVSNGNRERFRPKRPKETLKRAVSHLESQRLLCFQIKEPKINEVQKGRLNKSSRDQFCALEPTDPIHAELEPRKMCF